jgi:hypothetical protein
MDINAGDILIIPKSNCVRMPCVKAPEAAILAVSLLKTTVKECGHQLTVELHVLFPGMQSGVNTVDRGNKRAQKRIPPE